MPSFIHAALIDLI
jgi:hypothetical protein